MTDRTERRARRSLDERAAAGYRVLTADTAEFAAAAWPLAAEAGPEWEEHEPRAGARFVVRQAESAS